VAAQADHLQALVAIHLSTVPRLLPKEVVPGTVAMAQRWPAVRLDLELARLNTAAALVVLRLVVPILALVAAVRLVRAAMATTVPMLQVDPHRALVAQLMLVLVALVAQRPVASICLVGQERQVRNGRRKVQAAAAAVPGVLALVEEEAMAAYTAAEQVAAAAEHPLAAKVRQD